MSAGIVEPITALIEAGEDTLIFEFIRLETRYQMSDSIMIDPGDPLNISNCEEDEGEEDEIDLSGTVWG